MLQFPDLHKTDIEWHEFYWLEALVQRYQPGAMYATNELIRPTFPNGFFYKATTPGQASGREPNWPRTAAATVNDGSVVWTAQTPAVSAEPTIASAAYVISPSGELVESSTDEDNDRMVSRIRIDATGAKPGVYTILATMTDSAGEDYAITGQVRVID